MLAFRRHDRHDAAVPVEIRPETPDDRTAIRDVVRGAFAHHPPVADLVDLIRESPGFVPDLSLVACEQEVVVGHVMLSRGDLVDETDSRHEVLILSPLAVAPDRQRNGIGGALVREAVQRADAMGERMVVLQGSPRYYPRFGFRDCRQLGIQMELPDWAPPEAGMAYPLTMYDESIRGHLIEPAPFASLS